LQALVVGDGLAEAAATIASYLDNGLHCDSIPCALWIAYRITYRG
jgi:hypothetical protein